MDKTRIEQDSVEVTLADSSVVFQVTTTIIEPGILPDTGLFVFSIIDPAEPKSDEFVRVAQPHDINFMLRDRDNAIAAGNEEYLYVKVVLQYPSLEVAIQAKAAIKSRIDSAISRWYQYQTEFVGVVETLHPGVDPEYEQALRDTYVAARDARVLAETAVEDADDAVIAAQVLLDHAQEISDIRKDETGFCTVANGTLWPQLQTGLGTFNTGAGALFTASKTFWTAAKAFDDIADIFYTASNTFWNDLILCYNFFPNTVAPPDPLGPQALYAFAAPNNHDWDNFYATLQGYDGNPTTFNTALTTYGTAVSTYGPHATPGTSLAAFQTVLDAYTTTSTLITSMDMALSTFCATVIAAYSAALVQVTQKEESVATAVNTKNEAEAELASAQETEDAALAAVQEVCPDFETTSV
jgi:hypothetical protein